MIEGGKGYCTRWKATIFFFIQVQAGFILPMVQSSLWEHHIIEYQLHSLGPCLQK
jgi:hypothetical protein